jgi:hypothetical protein
MRQLGVRWDLYGHGPIEPTSMSANSKLGVTQIGGHMKAALEFCDSRIDQISLAGGGATIHFSHAYLHKASGTPGKDPGTGWSQEVQLVLESATHSGAMPSLPNTISDGYLEVGGIRHELVPLPFSRRGAATLALVFTDGTLLEVSGERPVIELIGVAKFLENYP